jgi:hypothetical protein
MQIAAEHAERQRVRSGQHVKERLLSDAALTGLDQTAMPARVTLKRVLIEMLGQLRRTFGGHLVQNFSE